jgi:hypothetical protein
MKKQICQMSSLLLVVWALDAHAQFAWTYETVDSDNTIKATPHPPWDISYPPENMRTPVNNQNEKQGIPITAEEEAARMKAPMLIIFISR